jgi:hypothetical protein
MHFFKASSTHPPVQTPIFQALPQKSKFGSLFLIGLVLRFPKSFSQTKTRGRDRFSRNRLFSVQGCTLEVG